MVGTRVNTSAKGAGPNKKVDGFFLPGLYSLCAFIKHNVSAKEFVEEVRYRSQVRWRTFFSFISQSVKEFSNHLYYYTR